jgi:ketosteroid isomerase-like protein
MQRQAYVEPGVTQPAGARLAAAIAAQDAAGLRAVLADELDFQALTPRRHWHAATGSEAVDDVILGHWFSPDCEVQELDALSTGDVAGREHVAYRLRVREAGCDYLVEQQAYYQTEDGRISWLRILCSGYQPIAPGS